MEKKLDFILDETKFYMTGIQKNYRHTSNLQNVLTKQEYTLKLFLSRWMEGYKDTQVVKVFKIIQHKNIDNQ